MKYLSIDLLYIFITYFESDYTLFDLQSQQIIVEFNAIAELGIDLIENLSKRQENLYYSFYSAIDYHENLGYASLAPYSNKGTRVVRKVMNYRAVQVRNVPPHYSEQALRGNFSQYGKIIRLITSETKTQQGRSIVYITYNHQIQAAFALKVLHGYILEGMTITTHYATDKYCLSLLKNTKCENQQCVFLHKFVHRKFEFNKRIHTSQFENCYASNIIWRELPQLVRREIEQRDKKLGKRQQILPTLQQGLELLIRNNVINLQEYNTLNAEIISQKQMQSNRPSNKDPPSHSHTYLPRLQTRILNRIKMPGISQMPFASKFQGIPGTIDPQTIKIRNQMRSYLIKSL